MGNTGQSITKRRRRRGRTIPPRLIPAIELIEANYDLPLRLADMAYETGLSIGRFCHLFKEQVGVTPMQYVTQIRIKHAKRLLKTGSMNNEAICDLIGYRRESYFIRIFKQETNTTPQAYRQAARHKSRNRGRKR
ncbi:MAG: helix-turn-helix transcriptional regulator [Sedimentisphaerales bacterium]|nr:helix-turn-helix transcriptional regulator [Sedimentisphaerales bacterium]